MTDITNPSDRPAAPAATDQGAGQETGLPQAVGQLRSAATEARNAGTASRSAGTEARNAGKKLSPILGLPLADDPAPRSPNQATALAEDPALTAQARPFELSVILPARDEEANLEACLHSLLVQSDDFFRLGRDWEVLVVDDASTDRTAAIASAAAASWPGLRVMAAPPAELRGQQRGFTGKTNACWAGAQAAQGRWLLFTDADTLHEPGNLRRALHEAAKHDAALLSYSPRQILSGALQHAVMPLIFSELASVYPPAEVNDTAKRTAAANGQFLLVEREAYFSVGGHRAVGRSVLEDVDLAWNIKRASARLGGRGIRLRFAPDALSVRMYRGFSDMVEGWTKNLALLFPHALQLAVWRLLDILLLLLPVLLYLVPWLQLWQKAAILVLWLRTLLRFYTRVSRSHFSFRDCCLAIPGLPLFIVLLLRSWIAHRILHSVSWKGRSYTVTR